MTDSVGTSVLGTGVGTQGHITYRGGLVLTLVPIPQGQWRNPR